MVEGVIFLLTGTFSAVTGWQIDDVVLPFGPESVKVAGGVNKEVMPQAESEPIQLVDGLAGSTLTLNGTIEDDSKTDEQLWADILSPLLGKRGSEVTLICTRVGLNGVYLLETFDVSFDKPLIYEYSMRLSKGSLNVVFTGEDGGGGI
jgi:hypothetical protein